MDLAWVWIILQIYLDDCKWIYETMIYVLWWFVPSSLAFLQAAWNRKQLRRLWEPLRPRSRKIATALVCSRSFSLWFMVDLMYQVLVDGWSWTAPWKWGWYFPYDETQLLLRLLPLKFGLRNRLIRGWQELNDSLLITPLCGEICELQGA